MKWKKVFVVRIVDIFVKGRKKNMQVLLLKVWKKVEIILRLLFSFSGGNPYLVLKWYIS